MYSKVTSGTIFGLNSHLITVEVDFSNAEVIPYEPDEESEVYIYSFKFINNNLNVMDISSIKMCKMASGNPAILHFHKSNLKEWNIQSF